MLKSLKQRIGRGIAALVASHLEQPELGSHFDAISGAPVVHARCMAYHHLVEAMLRQQLREGATTSETLEQIGREASERCRYELYGGESAAAVGAIEDLIEAIRRSLEAERHALHARAGRR